MFIIEHKSTCKKLTDENGNIWHSANCETDDSNYRYGITFAQYQWYQMVEFAVRNNLQIKQQENKNFAQNFGLGIVRLIHEHK